MLEETETKHVLIILKTIHEVITNFDIKKNPPELTNYILCCYEALKTCSPHIEILQHCVQLLETFRNNLPHPKENLAKLGNITVDLILEKYHQIPKQFITDTDIEETIKLVKRLTNALEGVQLLNFNAPLLNCSNKEVCEPLHNCLTLLWTRQQNNGKDETRVSQQLQRKILHKYLKRSRKPRTFLKTILGAHRFKKYRGLLKNILNDCNSKKKTLPIQPLCFPKTE